MVEIYLLGRMKKWWTELALIMDLTVHQNLWAISGPEKASKGFTVAIENVRLIIFEKLFVSAV